ncbi:MAG: hypothetical protein P1P85_03455 [Patescibacteria group bacterium]|nr:hypothetical protein [Patescibacteria group bacterium]
MKYIYNKILKNQNGQAAFLIVFFVMSILFVISMFLAEISIKQSKSTRDAQESIQAYYMADMGTERVIYGVRKIASDPNKININDYNIGDIILPESGLYQVVADAGSFTVKRVNVSLPATLGIKITGYDQNKRVSRSIELLWN